MVERTPTNRVPIEVAPTKAQVLKEHAAIKAKPESVVRSLLEKITGRPFYSGIVPDLVLHP